MIVFVGFLYIVSGTGDIAGAFHEGVAVRDESQRFFCTCGAERLGGGAVCRFKGWHLTMNFENSEIFLELPGGFA